MYVNDISTVIVHTNYIKTTDMIDSQIVYKVDLGSII